MAPLRPGVRRLFRLGRDAAAGVDDELRHHLEQRVAQLVAEGWPRDAAQREARRRLGGSRQLARLHAEARATHVHVRWREWLGAWLQDLRHAVRGLARDRVLAVFAILVLAIGLGANLTVLDLTERLLLRRSIHMPEPDRLFRFYGTTEWPGTSWWTPVPVCEALAAARGPDRPLGAYRVAEQVMGRGVGARRVRVAETHGAFFPVLGVRPVRGRLFRADEDRSTAGALAILSERVWRTAFDGAEPVAGRTIEIGDTSYEIVGVTPDGFNGPGLQRVDVWLLADPRTMRTMNWLVVGRLGPGETLAGVSLEAQAVHARVAAEAPSWYRDARLFAAPVRYGEAGRPPLEATLVLWLGMATLAILLVTFANLVSLLLVRLSRRERELAVRLALGSGRARVVRLLALEGALLAVAGGIAGLAVAWIIEPVLREVLFADTAGWSFSLLDRHVLGLLGALVLATMLVLCTAPVIQLGRRPLITWLRTSGRTSGPSGSRLRHGLTVVQAGLSVVLLAGAGLFLRSIERVAALDFGIERERLLTVTVDLGAFRGFREFVTREAEVLGRLQAAATRVPGVAATSVTIGRPLDGGAYGIGLRVPGRDPIAYEPGVGPFVSIVDSTYFATVGTALRRGRVFTSGDRAGSEPVVIINETMARRVWPDADALGQCIHIGTQEGPCARVVGIVGDVHRVALRDRPGLQIYQPHGQQDGFGGATLLVRQTRPGAVPADALRRTLFEAAPDVNDIAVGPITDAISGDVRPLRIGMFTFVLSGGLALIVAVLGLYGVMAYTVATRTHEIGVRSAIGASDAQITRLVIGSGVRLAALGVVLGLGVSIAAGRRLEPWLFETDGADPFVLAAVAVLLLGAALTAGWVPARRALRIDPVEALRAE